MAKPQFQDAFDPIIESDLEVFERQIDARLPDDFRRFLLRQNGGDFPGDVVFVARGADYRNDCLGVNHFYPLTSDIEILDGITGAYRIIHSELPKGFIPIANDCVGNEICVVVSARDFGAIWLWDHEAGFSDTWPPTNSKRITGSFSEFLDGLIYHPEYSDWIETIPAFRSAEQGDAETLSTLLAGGFDLESRNDRGQTLLICAANNRQSQIVQRLLECGANVNACDNHRRSALNCAAASSSLDSVKLLVAAGADLDGADDDGNTPLLRAVPGQQRVAFYLIEHGTNVNSANNRGHRPLQHCTGYGTDQLRAALIRAGADETLAGEPVDRVQLQLLHDVDFEDFD